MIGKFEVSHKASFACSVHASLLLLLDVNNCAIQILQVRCLVLNLLRVVVCNVFGASSHLLFHEGLSRGKSGVPRLELRQDIVNGGVFYIPTEGALHVQGSLLLVQPCFEKLMLQAQNDFIFQLTDVVNAQCLHELVVRHDSLLRCKVSNGD